METRKNSYKNRIKDTGLKKSYIANIIGVSSAHFSMMISNKATMPEDIRNRFENILSQYNKINP